MVDIAAAAAAAKSQMEAKAEKEAQDREMAERVARIKEQNRRDDEERERSEKADKEKQRQEAEAKKQAAADKKKADGEADRLRKAHEKIAADAEKVKRKQEAQDKAAEESARKAREQKIAAAEERDRKILESKEKSVSDAQRWAARRSMEARNEEVSNLNKPLATGMRQITPATIKASIKSAVKKVPQKLDVAAEAVFSPLATSLIAPRKKTPIQMYKEEMKPLSKVAKQHPKNPLTGTANVKARSVVPYLKAGQISVAPGFVDALMGTGGSGNKIRTHGKKKGGGLSGLDDFVRRL
jgi:hypothetical protein